MRWHSRESCIEKLFFSENSEQLRKSTVVIAKTILRQKKLSLVTYVNRNRGLKVQAFKVGPGRLFWQSFDCRACLQSAVDRLGIQFKCQCGNPLDSQSRAAICVDFLDPMHHEEATGRPSVNLDGWMLEKEQNISSFHRAMAGADVAVVEGVMGLFDGHNGRSEVGSTAQMAKWLGSPVVLVLDCWALSRSAAAMIKGYESNCFADL